VIAEATDIDIARLPYLQIRVVCSKGTYIRALARDIGQALNSGAYLIGLRRTRVGDIRIEDCLPVENVEQWCYSVPIVEQAEQDNNLMDK
jgi:tRNA pseudouridine55 synthase